MAGYIIGVGILVFAGWQLWADRRVEGSLEFTGTIVEVVDRKSTSTGRRRRLYAPRVAYRHPLTGQDEIHEPTSFGPNLFTVGEETRLVYDPAADEVCRPLDRPVRDTIILVLLGVGFIVAQAFDGR